MTCSALARMDANCELWNHNMTLQYPVFTTSTVLSQTARAWHTKSS